MIAIIIKCGNILICVSTAVNIVIDGAENVTGDETEIMNVWHRPDVLRAYYYMICGASLEMSDCS